MVMGPTHAMSGAAVGLAVADLLPLDWGGPTSTAETLTFAAVCAGAALLPDLDTSQSTVSRSFGPVSNVVAKGVDAVSLGFYTVTKGKRDGKRRGGHRTLTHTALFAVGIGAGVSALVVQFGKPAIIATLFVCLGLALRGLAGELAKEKAGWRFRRSRRCCPRSPGSRIPPRPVPPDSESRWPSAAPPTASGTPSPRRASFLAPFLTLGKERWWEFRLPSFLSIRAGGPFEKVVLGPALTVAVGLMVIWAIDGAPQAIYDAFMPAPQ